jgi:hypothetical protein
MLFIFILLVPSTQQIFVNITNPFYLFTLYYIFVYIAIIVSLLHVSVLLYGHQSVTNNE